MRNAVLGLLLAGAMAVAASPLTIAGIAAWKIVLAGFGLALFVTAGRGATRSGESGGAGRSDG
jgi:hypothetical protein